MQYSKQRNYIFIVVKSDDTHPKFILAVPYEIGDKEN